MVIISTRPYHDLTKKYETKTMTLMCGFDTSVHLVS